MQAQTPGQVIGLAAARSSRRTAQVIELPRRNQPGAGREELHVNDDGSTTSWPWGAALLCLLAVLVVIVLVRTGSAEASSAPAVATLATTVHPASLTGAFVTVLHI